MTGQVSRRGAVARALADAQRGEVRLARRRLRDYLWACPADLDARRLLAQLYRQDGHRDEAGRWGYLEHSAASVEERAQYERACSARLAPAWKHTYIRKGLRWPGPVDNAPEQVAALLRRLDALAEGERLAWQREATPLHRRVLETLRSLMGSAGR